MSLYLVRHCQSSGQEPDAPLTAVGRTQADDLAGALADLSVQHIVSSPFLRARQTAESLGQRLGLTVEIDARLAERRLSTDSLPDWETHLRASFDDPDRCLPGGESARTAAMRGLAAIEDAARHGLNAVVVTHGNLLSLILGHIDCRFGYDEWRALTNPDVFHLDLNAAPASFERIWNR